MAGVSNGAVYGARAAADMHAQGNTENPSASKSNSATARQMMPGNSRMPLSTVAPNRKGTNESVSSNRAIQHHRVEELGQQEAGMSRSTSEADSLLDLYNNGTPGNNNIDNDIPENMYQPEESDPDGWIHRDKLAKIESEELQAAGINLAKSRRNVSKTSRSDLNRAAGGSGRKGGGNEDVNGDTANQAREGRIGRVSEPVEEVDEEEHHRQQQQQRQRQQQQRWQQHQHENQQQQQQQEDPELYADNENADWDLRSPNEIAADGSGSQIYANHALKKSGSKIPILTSSPLPIPQEHLERDTPIQRKRTMSNSMSPEEGLPVLKTRSRKTSVGSQILLNDADGSETPTPITAHGRNASTGKQTSPTKLKGRETTTGSSPPDTAAGKKPTATTSGLRKPSATAKNLTPGTTSPTQKPNNLKPNEADRPRTAVNRPEGDPPWLATMYKPDPMLPPDQQIIPTHARRQQQSLWTVEGAIPTTYDRNFSPLAVHPTTAEDLSQRSSAEPSTSETVPWPLKPLPPIRSSNGNGNRPGTSGSTAGGYSMMPKVASPAIIHSPKLGGHQSSTRNSGIQTQRLQPHPEMDDEKANKKSCGCCIVM